MDTLNKILNEKLIIPVGKRVIEVNFYGLVMPCSGLTLLYFLFWRKTGFEDTSKLRVLKEQSVTEENPDDVPYQPEEINIPVVKGWLCTVYRKASRSLAFGKFLLAMAKKEGELDLLSQLMLPEEPTFHPIITPLRQSNVETPIDLESFIKPSDFGEDFHFNTISDYYNEYRNGSITPLEVAKNIIECIEDTCKKDLNIIIGQKEEHKRDILKRAEESTERWNTKNVLSVFDGIPVAVKDEIYLSQYPCCDGLPIKVAGDHVITEDEEGWMIRKLREGGAIFIGVTSMHQMGIGVTGINGSKLHGTSRNPYNTDYPCGGSSSGSAAAVGAGLCPIALGADGGGSIRIPSSVCGIVGAKNTYGRISLTGLVECVDTVGHPGPLCATVQDVRIAYGFLAGRDKDYEIGMVQPPPSLTHSELQKGLTIGIDWNFFNDCKPEIQQCCKAAVNYLVENYGMKVVDISIPEIKETSRAHIVTILSEMALHNHRVFEEYHDDINLDTEIYLRFGKSFSSTDYLKAQQQRTRCINIFKRLFKSVDCIITPTCGNFMPKLEPEMLKYGYLDTKGAAGVLRFCVMGNFAGNPSVSVPVGYSSPGNLPIGIMIHTAWWEEDLMYKIADAVKNYLKLKRPQIYYNVLQKSSSVIENNSNGDSSRTGTPLIS